MSASYPGAVKTFATKNNGDTVQASHIDDLQDEVNAIEAGLLNGTAPLNSSHSTLATLSVTGGSTLVGDVAMSGNLAVTGNLTVTGSLSGGAKTVVHHASTQAIPNNAWTGLNYDTEDVLASGMHSTGANSSRLIAAVSSGVYQITGGVSFAYSAASSAVFGVRLQKNDTTFFWPQVIVTNVTNGQTDIGISIPFSATHRFQSTSDYFTVQVFQRSGGSLQCGDSTVVQNMNFVSMVKL
jgi:hypothetical protein